ncbi:RING finger and transmembrane domain-containing protein 2-like [Juglans microcarpa x Juglans regia]|uniref:RING finger and transmembrane domain-containing protein 2-like n=1 Tax=Juglans microcarpa x Juglans regia TaxID=2249226 RepID=UPI001B7E8470|nr:RING finger and transmembrane domain-containing protein 2-like [Juglans microcarpa x Juglans regia]XP_041027426.1 RING finger and transmembrane domain-containing protein 2-like [Juglans microcarpa x Juglans regia]
MEASGSNLDTPYRRRYGFLSASSIIQAPLSALLEYMGLVRGSSTRSNYQETEGLIHGRVSSLHAQLDQPTSTSATNHGEVSIRIIGTGEHEHDDREATAAAPGLVVGQQQGGEVAAPNEMAMAGLASETQEADSRIDRDGMAEGISQSVNGTTDGEAVDASAANGRDSSYQRYDIQQAARWIEQVLPFSLLLLVVFIRQHLQGFFVTIWIAAVMFKSNDILRKQTALKGERKTSVLVGISLAFAVHVVGLYWWYQNDDLLYPLVMLPPKAIPAFWHAIFIIMVNDALVRQAAMALKCFLLMHYKNSRGRNYRKQGQMLTLVEYLLLLYRALLPTPVWYRFFLNKEYGSLFSSLMTGLYLTFKLTSIVEKVQSFFAAVKALSRKEVHYGAHATSEQVNAAGDMCAICQEKMDAPILLRCKHIFCEDCVSEWFERERTCPLCRALVKPADLRSFGDGSTSLFFQLF